MNQQGTEEMDQRGNGQERKWTKVETDQREEMNQQGTEEMDQRGNGQQRKWTKEERTKDKTDQKENGPMSRRPQRLWTKEETE